MIELAEMIRDLRRELTDAMEHGAGERLRFELGPVEIAATVTVTREAGAGAKVRFWVVEGDAQGRRAHEHTQQISLTLQPRLAGTNAPPFISGEQAHGER
ncbi:trypco2 family protein [Streptomyces sp. SID3343]|uniref:trypco2 family protein n=1 Tax=Streptomyces sp. SID3343 TaxID=2690260 RepID=UPI00136D411D|nr:trypco2 family protein [Streptomyces sp. SID3343]MYV97381.1 hypothetical protein [Streptomyces sp. SID3343]